MKLLKKISDFTVKTLKKSEGLKKETPEGFPFTRVSTLGAHQYRNSGERCDVSFIHPVTGKHRLIVDNMGVIQRFPGIIKEDTWVKYVTSKKYLNPIVRFRTSFEKWDEDRYIMLWQIQPDGRYWGDDDDFGMESDREITLYAFINHNGEFMGPFQIYRIGKRRYLEH